MKPTRRVSRTSRTARRSASRSTTWKAASPPALLTPYPPGIPLLIPGERFNKKIVDYLKFTRDFNAQFPGFDTDVHGLVAEKGEDGVTRYYVDCVIDTKK